MPRTCFHCDGTGCVDDVRGNSCESDDPHAIECETCEGLGEVEPTHEEIDEAEGDRLFHIKHDEGEV